MYRINLIGRIGKERVEKLDELAGTKTHRDDRMALIDIIETYKQKTKELKASKYE